MRGLFTIGASYPWDEAVEALRPAHVPLKRPVTYPSRYRGEIALFLSSDGTEYKNWFSSTDELVMQGNPKARKENADLADARIPKHLFHRARAGDGLPFEFFGEVRHLRTERGPSDIFFHFKLLETTRRGPEGGRP